MATATASTLDPTLRQRQASDPAASVWVGASAGSGKTKVLTDRVLRLMLAGTPPQRILCLTFTKAAAAEMSIRIGRTLGLWATIGDAELEHALAELNGERPDAALCRAARRLFARVVDCPGGMKLQTIHAFCQSLLRRFPLEAGLAPHFEVMDEATATEELTKAQHQVFERARAEPDRPLGTALARLTAGLHEERFAALVKDLMAERGRLEQILNRHGGPDGAAAEVCRTLGLPPGTDEASVSSAACTDAAFDGPGLRRACRALEGGSATDQERGAGIAAWLAATAADRAAALPGYLRHFLTAEGTVRKTLATKKAAAADAAVPEVLQAEAERLLALQERLKSAAVAGATAALLSWGQALLETYGRAKRVRALLDYDDLILTARRLLSQDGVAPWVLFKLDGGLDHILIDEAQDTNPDQWQVVARLAEEFFAGSGGRDPALVRTIFAVGDEKQSIFSFQRADPVEFARLRRHFAEKVQAAGLLWRQVGLDVSFRSTAAVLQAVDGVFAQAAARDGVVPDPAQVIRHHAFRRGQGGRVELWPPVRPEPQPEAESWSLPLRRERADSPPARLAAAIAATIRDWLDSGERLEARGRSVQPGDILVLVRRRTLFVPELVRALKERGVPVAGVDRMVLTNQLAVMDLMALAQVLLLREDDLTLAAVLKGPLIGLDEAALFGLAHGREGSLWRALADRAETDPVFRPAWRWLDGLAASADFTAPYAFFAGVLSRPCPGDAVSGLRALLGRLGPEARDPIDEFLTTCLTFQHGHPPSLQLFLHWLASSEAEIKREHDAGGGPPGGVVRIMTVHGAKGLQAPIVFLPDTMGVPTQSVRILWPEGERTIPLYAPRRALEETICAGARAAADQRRDQEYRRLLYVALTRAEDRLYVCGAEGKTAPPAGCWYHLIQSALAADGETRPLPFTAPGAGGWSGEALRLDQPQTAAPRRDPAAVALTPEPAPLPPWWNAPAPPEAEPSRPLTPSRPDEAEPAVASPLGGDDGGRFRRGLLLHRLFQTLPDLAPAHREAACRRFLARPLHGLSPAQQKEITREALRVLEHPDFAPLFGPGSRAEVPLVAVVGERVLSGQIDRLLVTPETVWVVDYKTNRPAPPDEAGVPAPYVRQLALYRTALRQLYPGRTVRCLLLWTATPHLIELSPQRLDAQI